MPRDRTALLQDSPRAAGASTGGPARAGDPCGGYGSRVRRRTASREDVSAVPRERGSDSVRSEMMEGRSQQPAWGEERVALELEAWFAERGFDVWPTYRTFVRDGRKCLHAEVVRCGGAARWALELGVPHVVPPRGPGLRDEEIAAALRTLLREHRPVRVPTSRWLARHGPPGLTGAVRRTGGGARWAQAFGMCADRG